MCVWCVVYCGVDVCVFVCVDGVVLDFFCGVDWVCVVVVDGLSVVVVWLLCGLIGFVVCCEGLM